MTDLIEVMPFSYQILESANGRFRVEGVFQRSDVENANKRVYPRSIWERELKEPRVTESLTNRAMFGELDHPSDGKTSLKRVSHIVTGLNLQDDGSVIGVAEVLGTPNGQILKTLFESGAQVGISSRGSGSVQNGVVQEDFKLSTFDFVARPSTPGALPRLAGEVSRRGSKTEDVTDASTEVEVVDVMDVDLFNRLQKELATLEEGLDTNIDFNTLARSVIELHNLVEGLDAITPKMRSSLNEHILVLSGELTRLAAESPEHQTIVAELLKKVEESLEAVIIRPTNTSVKEEPMDRLQFIKDRLQEAELEATVDATEAEMQLAAEVDELRQNLEALDDDELVDVALEVGVISPDDLEEDDDTSADDDSGETVTVQDLLDYIEELEGQVGEAAELIEGMAAQLEESDDSDDLTLKYEAALGIIQETVTRYHFLQEAVGGEERANKLMENLLQRLESDDEDDDEDDEDEKPKKKKGKKEESLDEAVAEVEKLLSEDGDGPDKNMLRYKELAESVRKSTGLN